MIKWKLVLEFYLTFLIPLLYLANIFISLKNPQTINLPISLIVLGVLIAAVGLIIWLISYINLGNSFGVLPKKQKKVKTGLYKYTNHPMYLGIWLCFLGLSIANSSWQGLIFLNLVITPILFIRARFEDKKLLD